MDARKRWRWQIAQAAEIRWWQWYLGNKDKSQYYRSKKGYWHRVMRGIGADPAPGDRVLDAGCGPAGIFTVLPQCRVDGLDPLLAAYREKLPQFCPEDYPWTRFIPEPLESLREEKKYDWVFCLNAINHVADLERCLDNLGRALRPGGLLLLGVDAHRHAPLKALFRWLPGDVLHPHQHALGDYRARLRDRGLREEKCLRLRRGAIFDYFVLRLAKGQ